MAITTLKRKTNKKYLLMLLGVAILGSVFLIWQKFFQSSNAPTSALPSSPEEIRINFSVLETPFIKELQPFPKIPPFEGQVGRTNPLSPY